MGDLMLRTFTLIMLGGSLAVPLLSSPIQAQTAPDARREPGKAASDVTSVKGCSRPADAKEAKVLTFDEGSLTAKLVVSLGPGEFKVVTIKLWNHREDPRPVSPVIEAARITQGKLQFYTPDLNADPEPIHDKFVLVATMGGAPICWANPGSLLKEGTRSAAREARPEGTPAAATPAAARRATRER